jgi:hypothetical protein
LYSRDFQSLDETCEINPFEQATQGSTPTQAGTVIQKTLQLVVDALITLGIPASAIEVNSSPSSSAFPFPFPFPIAGNTAKLLVTIAQRLSFWSN